MSLKKLIIIVVVSFPFSSHASKFADCVTYLLSARQYHLGETNQSKDLTRQALRDLNFFRSRKLGKMNYQAADEPASALDSSNNEQKLRVANRITGLLQDAEGNVEAAEDESASFKTRVLGQVISGVDEIKNELRNRVAFRADASRLHDWTRGVAFALAPMYFGFAGLIGGAEGASMLALGLLVIPRMPEECVRWLEMHCRTLGPEHKLMESLNELKETQWLYRGFDIRMTRDLPDHVWGQQGVVKDDYEWFVTDYIEADFTKRMIPLFKKRDTSGILRVDEALTWNPLTSQPELITVIRMQTEIPIRPQPVTEPSRLLKTSPRGI